MTKFYLAIFLLSILLLTSCVKEIKNNDSVDSKNRVNEYALVIHGGAGNIYKGRYTEEEEKLYKDKLSEALILGKEILTEGGSSVDAVETVIRVLEDSPLFNAGKGAVFTEDGNVELDASIMNGKDISAGGVASLKHIKNPITLARFVMEHSPHVLLFGEGAEKFADEFGMQKVDNDYFKTEERIEEYNKNKTVASIENTDY
ncbi:MAG: isoaspartyl peptidase/L-asparaginase, partial [Ignavibacteriae bacterium]|nr:isoaspartyl peptidase/L-asparaginase [Ignavibacteriota bacterium]